MYMIKDLLSLRDGDYGPPCPCGHVSCQVPGSLGHIHNVEGIVPVNELFRVLAQQLFGGHFLKIYWCRGGVDVRKIRRALVA